jgi:hypothetical protein
VLRRRIRNATGAEEKHKRCLFSEHRATDVQSNGPMVIPSIVKAGSEALQCIDRVCVIAQGRWVNCGDIIVIAANQR